MKKIILMSLIIMLMGGFVCLTQPTIAAEKPKYGGTLTFNMFPPVSVLGNPLKFRGPDHEYLDNTLQTLIRPSNEKRGELEPLLAESWEVASDKSYYISIQRTQNPYGLKKRPGRHLNMLLIRKNSPKS